MSCCDWIFRVMQNKVIFWISNFFSLENQMVCGRSFDACINFLQHVIWIMYTSMSLCVVYWKKTYCSIDLKSKLLFTCIKETNIPFKTFDFFSSSKSQIIYVFHSYSTSIMNVTIPLTNFILSIFFSKICIYANMVKMWLLIRGDVY